VTDPSAEARRIVSENSYLTLATADADGTPWANPVWFAAHGLEEFVWASKPGARHSQSIAVRPSVGIVIFDSTVTPGQGAAVYVEAFAEEVGDADWHAALAIYNERSRAQGLAEWSAADLTGDARHRLYRARAARVYVLDDHDERILVDGSEEEVAAP
jgi:nitroimidazol reductase NimA-like FMN-containing flavoprotein (pyridoxamine 5'-phosphate oxidase superfamily)